MEGSHYVDGTDLIMLRGWYPLEVLHFPIRTAAQLERKGRVWGSAVQKFYSSEAVAAGPGAAYHALHYRDAVGGESGETFDEIAIGDDAARDAIERGSSRVDTRLRDVLAAEGDLRRSRTRRRSTTQPSRPRPPCSARPT